MYCPKLMTALFSWLWPVRHLGILSFALDVLIYCRRFTPADVLLTLTHVDVLLLCLRSPACGGGLECSLGAQRCALVSLDVSIHAVNQVVCVFHTEINQLCGACFSRKSTSHPHWAYSSGTLVNCTPFWSLFFLTGTRYGLVIYMYVWWFLARRFKHLCW